MKTEFWRDLLIPVYTVGVLGAFLQIAGGYWDVSWHFLGLVENFLGPNHVALYTGVVLVLLAAVYGFFMRLRVFRNNEPERHVLTGLLIALVGGGMQVIAGPLDFWWHSTFGFDPFLFTPSHTLLIVGIVLNGFGMAIGSARLLQAHRARFSLGRFFVSSKWLQLLVVVALTTLWLDLNTLLYLATDVDGIAYTLGLCNDPVSCGKTEFVKQTSFPAFVATLIVLAATGTLVFFSAKSILGWRGAVTAIALLSATVSATANLGFRASVLAGKEEGSLIASFIPLYLSFVVPVFLFDLLVKDSHRKRTTLLASVLISPFASYLDGWYSLVLWVGFSQLIPILIVPMFLVGLITGFSRVRFTNALLSQKITAVAATSARVAS